MTENPWRRLARQIAYDNAWITVWHDDVVRPDGQPGIYGVVHYRARSIAVIALDEQDHVILVGQYRYPLNRYSWELPQGGGLPEEEPLAAAKRELREETGFSAANWEEILVAHMSNAITDEETILYLARGLTEGIPEPEGSEKLQVRRVPFAEALAKVERGEITDAPSMIGLLRMAIARMHCK